MSPSCMSISRATRLTWVLLRFGWHHPVRCISICRRRSTPPRAAAARAYAGAAAINLAALAALLTILIERRPWIAAAVAVSCLTFAWRLPRFLASPWTAHIPVLPFLAFVVLAAAVASGRAAAARRGRARRQPGGQTHVPLGPAVAGGMSAARRSSCARVTAQYPGTRRPGRPPFPLPRGCLRSSRPCGTAAVTSSNCGDSSRPMPPRPLRTRRSRRGRTGSPGSRALTSCCRGDGSSMPLTHHGPPP